jgi:hypothetical protein
LNTEEDGDSVERLKHLWIRHRCEWNVSQQEFLNIIRLARHPLAAALPTSWRAWERSETKLLTEGGLIPFKIIAAKVGIESKYYGCYIP